MYMGFLNISQKLVFDYHKYDSTSAQDVVLGEISYVYKRIETD